MRHVVGPDLGVKAAGGIRTYADAMAMVAGGADPDRRQLRPSDPGRRRKVRWSSLPRPRVQQTEAIVLRERGLCRGRQILTLLTPAGKVTVLARGVRKPTSRKAGHLGLFHRTRVMLAQGRNMDLVTQAEALDVYEGLWHDLLRFTYACYAAELIDRFVPEDEGSSTPYELLCAALERFATGNDLRLWARYFELSLLQQTGYLPSLYQCVVCGTELPG